MGQSQSYWQNKTAAEYTKFLVTLFGNPYIYSDKSEGAAIWISQNFQGKTLFGMPVCFSRMMIVDDTTIVTDGISPETDFLFVSVKIPVTLNQHRNLLQLSQRFKYDPNKQYLSVRASSIDEAIIMLKFATDVITGKTSVDNLVSNGVLGKMRQNAKLSSTGSASALVTIKQAYSNLLTNLGVAVKAERFEKFKDSPHYGLTENAYASNQPLDIALVDGADNKFYSDMASLQSSISKSADAYPRAPSSKPSLENFNNLQQDYKKRTLISGKQINPGLIQSLNLNSNQNSNQKSEHLIGFNAYAKYTKDPNTPQEGFFGMPNFLKKTNI